MASNNGDLMIPLKHIPFAMSQLQQSIDASDISTGAKCPTRPLQAIVSRQHFVLSNVTFKLCNARSDGGNITFDLFASIPMVWRHPSGLMRSGAGRNRSERCKGRPGVSRARR